MAEPKLQGFSHDHTKPCSPWREKLPCFNVKSMAWELLRANDLEKSISDSEKRAVGNSIKTVLEGATGNLAAAGIIQLIAGILG